MLQKAGEIQNQLFEFKEEIRKKRLALEFHQCGRCRSQLDFNYQVSHDFVSGRVEIVETGSCPRCLGQTQARRFEAH
jgi:uncharacterized protein with PIN domain